MMSPLFSSRFESAIRKELFAAGKTNRTPQTDPSRLNPLDWLIENKFIIVIALIQLPLVLVGGFYARLGLKSGFLDVPLIWFGLFGMATSLIQLALLRAKTQKLVSFSTQTGLPITDSQIFRQVWGECQKTPLFFSATVLTAGVFQAWNSRNPFIGFGVAIAIAILVHLLRDAVTLGLLALSPLHPLFRKICEFSLISAIPFIFAVIYIPILTMNHFFLGENLLKQDVFLYGFAFGKSVIIFPVGMAGWSIRSFFYGNYLSALGLALPPLSLIAAYPFLLNRVRNTFQPPTVEASPAAAIRNLPPRPVIKTAPTDFLVLSRSFLEPTIPAKPGFLDKNLLQNLETDERIQLDAILGESPRGRTRTWALTSIAFLTASLVFQFFPFLQTLERKEVMAGLLAMLFMWFSTLVFLATFIASFVSALGYRGVPEYDGLRKMDMNPYVLLPFDWKTLIRARRKIGRQLLCIHAPVWILGFTIAGLGLGSTARGLQIGCSLAVFAFVNFPLFPSGLLKAARWETDSGNLLTVLKFLYFAGFLLPQFLALIILPIALSGRDLLLFGAPLAALLFAGNRFVERWLLKLYDSGRLEMMK